jgi:hypothetical protein
MKALTDTEQTAIMYAIDSRQQFCRAAIKRAERTIAYLNKLIAAKDFSGFIPATAERVRTLRAIDERRAKMYGDELAALHGAADKLVVQS